MEAQANDSSKPPEGAPAPPAPAMQMPFVQTAPAEVVAFPGQESVPAGQSRAIPIMGRATAVPMASMAPPVPVVPPPSALGGQELPEIRKLDIQMLLQDLAQQQRTLFQERGYFERCMKEERERSRFEQERLRAELGAKLLEAEKQNEVLIRTLGRIQQENDGLRESLAVLRSRASIQPTPMPVMASEPERRDPPNVLQLLGKFPGAVKVGNLGAEGERPVIIPRSTAKPAFGPQVP